MRKLLSLGLGIMTALGGFVDLGQIVFTMQGGALFGYQLLWVIAVGLIAIIIYMEMCGRIAAVAKEPVFAVVKSRLSPRLGLLTLIASNLLNLITCAAELGAIGIVLHLAMGWSERASLTAAVIVLGLLIWLMKLQWIERVLGLAGMMMVVFAVSAYVLQPDWSQLASGFIPQGPPAGHGLLYAYFAIGIFSAMLMEYEVHFYSSGAIEEDWDEKSLGENVVVASIGSTLGAFLTCALLVLGVLVFMPRSIFPDALSTTLMPAALPFGPTSLRLAFGGVLACIIGAAVETALSGAYNVCQFYNLSWGKNLKAKDAPVFTFLWVGMLMVAFGIAVSGIRPLMLVDVSIVFGMIVMPFTYYPILRMAGDRNVLGEHANGKLYNAVGWIFLVIVILCAIVALPLTVITKFGTP